MTAVTHLAPQRVTEGRPTPASLVIDQVGYALREMWRTRIVLIFTFVLPLVWLVLIGILAGNDAVDEASGVRVVQFVTPIAAAMGVLFSSFPPVANGLALAREQRIMKRLQGTPLPLWAYLVGRVGAAVLLATASVVVMVGVGVVAYEVQIQWRSVVATLVTLMFGVACLASLGLAVGALAPSSSTAEVASTATAIGASFASGLFTVGAPMPDWLLSAASLLPLRPFATALQDQFNPFLTGPGWDVGVLVMLAAWAALGIGTAAWALRRQPRASAAATAPAAGTNAPVVQAAEARRPTALRILADQTQWANLTAWRDVGWVFWAVAMPAGIYALFSGMYADVDFNRGATSFPFFFAASMAAYGSAVTAFITMPEAIAKARDRGLLKRIRGTPLEPWQYLAGRTVSVLLIALVTAVVVYGLAIMAFGVEIALGSLPIALAVLTLGTLSLAACGYALAAIIPSGRAMGVVALGILLPLSFFSDVFIMAPTVDWMTTVGSLFPLRHFVYALAAATNPAGVTIDLANLAGMVVWIVGAGLVAIRFFRWEPRR